ncbi:MAG: PQQ-binding-like beta-propeller repeat protein [Bacteroidia bacterium]|nr:PQQ-binding-like beta-propeller repeat protein [Bacteroidia bacterium]
MTHLEKLTWNKLLRITIVTLLAFEITPACSQIAAQWRGINRDGQYSGSNLLKAWPENGPELLWFTEEIGNGYGAPTIANDRIYINGETDSVSYLFAFDLKGKLLWKTPNGNEFTGSGFSARFPGSRSAPTILGNLAYSCSGKGRIACFETADGKEKWAIDMIKELGGREFEHGYSESLVVDAENVYCFPGGTTTNAAALNRFTGKPVWTSKVLRDTMSYCSPMIVKLPERKILVNYSRYFLLALDCSTGELLWSYPIKGARNDAKHCNTPIYTGGYLYSVSAEVNGGGVAKFELSPDGRQVKEIWTNNQVKNALGGFVVVGNNLFTTIEKNYLYAVELNQGTIVDSVKVRNGNLVFSDNKFFCYGNNGEVNLIDYDQNKLNVTGKLKIEKGSKDHFAHPVLADGVLYIRHGKALMAYKVK